MEHGTKDSLYGRFHKAIRDAFACPHCGSALEHDQHVFRCVTCEHDFGINHEGALDLRPRRAKRVDLTFEVPRWGSGPADVPARPLERKPHPEVEWSGLSIPRHLSAELLSYFPRASRDDAVALDLGCGTGLHREVLERAGYHYLGIDATVRGAPIHADAHALPLHDDSIDFVMSIAVFEHLSNPFLAAREVMRVLRPGGYFIGTVAFLEPFHSRSYFHHSHLGITEVLRQAGFEVEHLGPNREWSVLFAQAKNGLFPGMPKRASSALVRPIDAAHRVWWRLVGTRHDGFDENTRLVKLAGAFRFVARAPVDEA